MDQNSQFIMHDNAKVNIDNGDNKSSRINPEIFIHGQLQCYIADCYSSGRTQYINTYGYDYENGPRIYINGAPLIALYDRAALNMNDYSRLTMQGHSSAVFEENSIFSLKDDAHVIFQGTSEINIGGSNEGRSTSKTCISISDDTKLYINAKKGDSPRVNIHGNCHIHFDALPYTGDRNGVQFKVKHLSEFLLCHSSVFLMQGFKETGPSPAFYMQGPSRIIMNCTEKDNYAPAIVFDPDSLKMGGKWGQNTCGDTLLGGEYPFCSLKKLSENRSRRCPEFNITGSSQIMINDGVNKGGVNYINISSDNGMKNVILIHNDSFIHHSGSSHEELHDCSTFIMRGPIDKTTAPILPKNYPNKRSKPWQDYYADEDGVEEQSRRPMKPRTERGKVGPLNSMYDESIFFMRGKWDLEKDVIKAEKVSFTLSEDSSLRNDSEITMDKLKEDSDFKNWQQQTQQFYDADLEYTDFDFTGETNQVSINSATGEVTIQNYIFTTCPPNWSAEVLKREDSPLLEVSENAEVRVKGDIAIFVDDSGITIKHKNLETEDLADSSDSIQFIFEELKKLKQYLTNVPTSDIVLTDEETSKQYKLNVTNKKVNIEEINSTS